MNRLLPTSVASLAFAPLLGLTAVLFASPAYAQDAPAAPNDNSAKPDEANASNEPEPLPIIVFGTKAGDKKEIVAGSRIARKPILRDGPVASSTGTPGFTPGSGMTPYGNYTRTLRKVECTASDENIGKDVACRLIAAKEASEIGEWNTVRGLLVPVARDDEASAQERRAAADYLYLTATQADNNTSRIEALELLIDTGTLADADAAKALRHLSSLSRQQDNASLARDYLAQAVMLDPDHIQSLVNLAVMEREADLNTASQTMTRAIAAAERAGGDVPQSWRDFVAK